MACVIRGAAPPTNGWRGRGRTGTPDKRATRATPNMNLTNFDQLVRALREGDPAPVEAFLRLHEPPLRHIIRMRLRRSSLGRHLDSVDVCQSILRIFLRRAQEGRLHLRTPEEVRAFLLAM